MCEAGPLGWNGRRRGWSGKKGDRLRTLIRPCLLGYEGHFREFGTFLLEDGAEEVLWGPHVMVGDFPLRTVAKPRKRHLWGL